MTAAKLASPLADHAAKHPAPGTQCAGLLFLLRAGCEITPLESWRELGIYRLAARVNDLRSLGWPIQTELVRVHNQFGDAVKVASYRMGGEGEA